MTAKTRGILTPVTGVVSSLAASETIKILCYICNSDDNRE